MGRESRLSKRYLDQEPLPDTSPRTLPAVLLHVVALGFHLNAFRLLWLPTPVKQYMDKQYGGEKRRLRHIAPVQHADTVHARRAMGVPDNLEFGRVDTHVRRCIAQRCCAEAWRYVCPSLAQHRRKPA